MTYKKKLIEVALPLELISTESAREKSIPHGHPSSLHLWWARRPLAAARAVLWASLVDDPSSDLKKFPTFEKQAKERQRLFEIMARLIPWEASNDVRVLEEARTEILSSCNEDLPNVLDPFGGGGAIPLESVRLGMPTFTGDLNPVAVTIQRAMIEIPHRFAGKPPINPESKSGSAFWVGLDGLVADIQYFSNLIREKAIEKIGHLYPNVELPDGVKGTTVAYIWARGVRSPDPAWNETVPLVKSWSLSKRKGKDQIWIKPNIDQLTKKISYQVVIGGTPPPGTVDRGNGECIASGSSIPSSYIKSEGKEGRLYDVPLAMVVDSVRGREFREFDGALIEHLAPEWEPSGAMSDHSQYMGTPRYGLDEWRKLFTKRQLIALSTFSELISSVHEEIRVLAKEMGEDTRRLREGGSGPVAYADALQTYLSFVFDKCLNSWSSLATWSDSGFVRPVFARQAIPMTWDFAEVNPFSEATGNWMGMTDWVVKAVRNLPHHNFGETSQRDAEARIAEIGKCMISTDPPYYDNVPYADLSDYFYVWMRKNLSSIWPEEFATLLTPKAEELVANHVRAGSWEAAQSHFQEGMFKVFQTARRMSDERFPTTIFYAFKAAETSADETVSTGWEVFLAGLLDAGYSVVATWPIRTEKPGRSREIGAAALSSSVVLVCRARSIAAAMATRGEFISALRNEMTTAIKILQVESIAPVDMAQSAIGPGIGIFSRYSRVVEADGKSMSVRTALSLINEVLAEILSGEESEFDADTRFAVTWFEQFAHNSGSFGDADTLARAKNTTVNGVVESGIAASRDGKLRLFERNELSDKWDPTNDKRLTVWETTQYLIRALEESELKAAELLARLGSGVGERARQLAYLLYGICDRKKWASESSPYNMLVSAWPEIEKLSKKDSNENSSSDTLF